jgi:predicted  nucleic acid-binding Zn-ribbon protein
LDALVSDIAHTRFRSYMLLGAPPREIRWGQLSMEVSVRYHIEKLERRIQDLGIELMNTKDHAHLNDLETEIRVANMALQHYREALRLESTLQK